MYTTRKIRFQHRLFIFISILSAVMAQIKTDRNQSNVIFHNALVRYASVFGFIRIHDRNRRPGDRIFHFFLWSGRVTQRGLTKQFCNPSPLCANWQSPPEEFHNNFDDIYSGFFLFFSSLSFFPLVRENETFKSEVLELSWPWHEEIRRWGMLRNVSRRRLEQSRVIDEIIALARGLREIRGKMTDASVFELNVFSINESRLRKIDLPYEINRTKGDIEYKWNGENISFSRVPFGTQFIIEIFT